MGAAPRQFFQGRDDILLLSHVAQAPPWRQPAVMEAWHRIAQALNADAACSLSTLAAATARARFFRLVAQRRARQDKMLRRGVPDELEFRRKLELLDALIARLDAADEESSLHQLLRGVDAEEDAGIALPLPLPLPVSSPYMAPAAPQTVMPMQRPRAPPAAAPRPHVQAQSQPRQTSTTGNAALRNLPLPQALPVNAMALRAPVPPAAKSKPAKKPPVAQRPAPAAMAVVIPTDSLEPVRHNGVRDRPTEPAPPAKRPATGDQGVPVHKSDAVGNDKEGWESIAGRALEFMQRKLESDSEAAAADRSWRREEARARQEEMKMMRDQTDRLIHAVLKLAQARS